MELEKWQRKIEILTLDLLVQHGVDFESAYVKVFARRLAELVVEDLRFEKAGSGTKVE